MVLILFIQVGRYFLGTRMKFKLGERIVFEPKWWKKKYEKEHPLKFGEHYYFISNIPNVPGHCIVATHKGLIVPMIHPEDLRKAREDEL